MVVGVEGAAVRRQPSSMRIYSTEIAERNRKHHEEGEAAEGFFSGGEGRKESEVERLWWLVEGVLNN